MLRTAALPARNTGLGPHHSRPCAPMARLGHLSLQNPVNASRLRVTSSLTLPLASLWGNLRALSAEHHRCVCVPGLKRNLKNLETTNVDTLTEKDARHLTAGVLVFSLCSHSTPGEHTQKHRNFERRVVAGGGQSGSGAGLSQEKGGRESEPTVSTVSGAGVFLPEGCDAKSAMSGKPPL